MLNKLYNIKFLQFKNGAGTGTRTLNSDLEGHDVTNYTIHAKMAAQVGIVDKEIKHCYIALDKGFEPFHINRDLGLTVQCRHLAGSSRAI